ncbi:MAG: hypothetical protein ACPGFA_06350 [Pikeienuella sp.]
MSTGFSDFADAMSQAPRQVPAPARRFDDVAILGGGADARLLAALALSEGANVRLFSAYGAELEAMKTGIALRGAGPVGSYQVNSDAAPSVQITAELDQAVRDAELIILTGPIHKQRTYAMVLADHLSDGQVLALSAGRSFAALETRWLLSIGGCSADVTIVEAGPLPYWFTVSGSTLNLSNAVRTPVAALPAANRGLLDGLTRFGAGPAALNVMKTSFADGSGLVEAPALLLGGAAAPQGGPEVKLGGVPLAENDTFRNQIGGQHMTVIGCMADERREVARRFGVRDLPDVGGWLDIHAGATSGDGARPVPSHAEALGILRDAAIGSLSPLISAARLVGVATPATDAMLALASTVLNADLATAGRSLPAMGVNGGDADTARRALENAVGA